MMQAYGNLYAAIFRQAVDDDVQDIKASVYGELINLGHDKENIHKFIDSAKSELKHKVALYVEKEANCYPINSKGETNRNKARIVKYFISRYKEDKP